MENWVITAKRADFNEIGRKFHIDPVTARLIRNRDIVGDDAIALFLNGTTADIPDPFLVKGMRGAAAILTDKIADGASIRVVGDYDIDGVMATYSLKQGIAAMGGRVSSAIPHRILDGYGISERIIRQALRDGVDTIITCDNGISAWDVLREARAQGLTTIVTDHHEVTAVPEADAVVDPKQPGCGYPFKQMCGAGIAWMLMRAVNCPILETLLPYVAFGTIGDIVSLTGCNRILVRDGLEKLRQTTNPGLLSLAEACGITMGEIDTYEIGFVLGPCLNACGRLDSADTALALLEETDRDEAVRKAIQVKALNDRRKVMTEEGVLQAERCLSEDGCADDSVYVLYLPGCHESIAGIIAGRIREKYGHPTFILTDSGDILKGSGRSVEGMDMFVTLSRCEDLLLRFGGHSLAAGLSLERQNLDAFRQAVNAESHLKSEDLITKVKIDMAMPMSYVTEGLIEEMACLKPFGTDNPQPLFAMKDVTAENVRLIGRDGSVLKMTLTEPGGRSCEAIAFRRAAELYDRIRQNRVLSVTYYPTINEFRGRRTLQAVITHFR